MFPNGKNESGNAIYEDGKVVNVKKKYKLDNHV